MRKVFLKLDGIKGESQNAGHKDEIEIASFYWGRNQMSTFTAGSGLKDLTIIKRADKSTPYLRVASTSGQDFQGQLTLEDFTARGSLVRSIAFELQSVFVDSVTGIQAGEVIALSCKSIKLVRS
jgi:type VI secretion system secreted protein Hcp